MNTNLLLCLLLLPFLALAQEKPASGKPLSGSPAEARRAKEGKGASPAKASAKAGNSLRPDVTTRAVIVGISDYQNKDIPDLQYAHKDAEALVTYLQSPAGGSLPQENIRLLTNEKATLAAIVAEFDWLVEASQAGDQAIIYFSGHGDVEAKTARQPGFLLTYDSPPKLYMAGAYPLFYLQLTIETLTTVKNVSTIVVTDACRAGKLAGSAIGGTQATASNLAKQYANEVKILSCQPDEFSLEGEQWGGGRGAFSYHLIEGLIGLADKNENGSVNLLELENYLETVVPAETDPQTQIPITVGSKGTRIANVDTTILAKLKDLKARQLPTLAAIESKGLEESLLAGIDSSIQKKYDAFIVSLQDKNLLDAGDGKPSADALYRDLIKEKSLASLHRFMTRRFATALQDDAQQAINAYLLANPTELEKRWKGDHTYAQYPRYLGRAAELLGESHYMYKYLLAKKLYFEGLNLRLQADNGITASSYQEAIKKQEAALKLEDRAAYFYNELGILHTRLKLSEKAAGYYKKAIEMAPEWGLPYINLCLEYFYNNDNQKAIEIGDKAIKLMPEYPQLYNLMAWVNANYKGEYSDKRNWNRKGVELKEDFYFSYDNTSTFFEKKTKYKRTIELLQKAVQLDSLYASAHSNLAYMYGQTGEGEAAVSHFKKSIQIDSTNHNTYSRLGLAYGSLHKCDAGERAFKKAIELAMIHAPHYVPFHYNDFGLLYRGCGNQAKALEVYEKAMELNGSYGSPYANSAAIYRNRGAYEIAETRLLRFREVMPANDPRSYISLGRYFEIVNRWEDCEWMYLKTLEVYPNFRTAMQELIAFYQNSGLQKKALEWQEKLLAISPDDPASHRKIAELAYLNKQYKRAKSHFDKAVKLSPGNPSTTTAIAGFYFVHNEKDLAEKYIDQAFKIDSSFGTAYSTKADMLYYAGRTAEAFDLLDKGIALQKNKLDRASLLIAKMSMAYFESDYNRVISLCQQIEKETPVLRGIEILFQSLINKDYEAAASAIEAFLKIYPTDAGTNYYNSLIKIKLHNYEAALKSLNVAAKGIPYHSIQTDPELEPLRHLHGYQQLMRENYPEKYEDLEHL